MLTCLCISPVLQQGFNKDLPQEVHLNKAQKIRVYCGPWSKRVSIKLDTDKQAILTTKWMSVVAHEAFEIGTVVTFRFRHSTTGRLLLYVEELYPCHVCANAAV